MWKNIGRLFHFHRTKCATLGVAHFVSHILSLPFFEQKTDGKKSDAGKDYDRTDRNDG